MDEQILEQLEKVRASGRVNMCDRRHVQAAANQLGLHALVLWLEDNRKRPGLYMDALEEMGNRRDFDAELARSMRNTSGDGDG